MECCPSFYTSVRDRAGINAKRKGGWETSDITRVTSDWNSKHSFHFLNLVLSCDRKRAVVTNRIPRNYAGKNGGNGS